MKRRGNRQELSRKGARDNERDQEVKDLAYSRNRVSLAPFSEEEYGDMKTEHAKQLDTGRQDSLIPNRVIIQHDAINTLPRKTLVWICLS